MFENSASRILSLVLLTLIVNTQGWSGVLLFVLPLAVLFFRYPQSGRQTFQLARKLRWFYLSITILYFWFYPGTDLLPAIGRLSPSVEGVAQALQRVTSLLIIISYSSFLILLTTRDDLISGLQFILTPLQYIGIDSQRFSLRLGLVLAIVPQISVQKYSADKKKGFSMLIDNAVDIIRSTTENNNKFELNEVVTIKQLARPGILDILVPLSLLGALLWTN